MTFKTKNSAQMQYFLRRNSDSHINQRSDKVRLSINDVQFCSGRTNKRSFSSIEVNYNDNQTEQYSQHRNAQKMLEKKMNLPSIFSRNEKIPILQSYQNQYSKQLLKSASEVKIYRNVQAINQAYKFLSKNRYQEQKFNKNDSLVLNINEKTKSSVFKPKLSPVHHKISKQTIPLRNDQSHPDQMISKKLMSLKIPQIQGKHSLLYNFDIQKKLIKMTHMQEKSTLNRKNKIKNSLKDSLKQPIDGWKIQKQQANQMQQLDQVF